MGTWRAIFFGSSFFVNTMFTSVIKVCLIIFSQFLLALLIFGFKGRQIELRILFLLLLEYPG